MSLLRRLKQKSSRKSGKGRPTTTKSWKSVSVEDLEGGVAGQLLGVEVLDPNNDEYDQLINALKPTTQQEKDDEEEHVVKGSILKKRKASEEVVEGSIRGEKKSKNKKKKKTTVEDISPIDRIEDLSDMNEWKSISSSIPDEILMGLKGLGFTIPTQIQRQSIPPALLPIGKDILAAAETGSGKTLAYGIPLLTNILYMESSSSLKDDNDDNSNRRRRLDAIVVVPTRELAMQVYTHLIKVGHYIPHLLIAPIVGGMSIQKQHRLMHKVPNIIVATPGRLAALLGCATIKVSGDVLDRADTEIQASDELRKKLIPQLRTIVLDEADRLVADEGHFKDLTRVLDIIYTTTQVNKIQHLVFSATLATESSHITGIVSKREKKRIEKSRNQIAGDKITRLLSKLRLRTEKHREVIDLTKGDSVNAKDTSSSLPDTLTFKEIRVSVDKDREAALLYYLHYRFGPKSDKCKEDSYGKIIMFVNSISYVYRLSSILSLATSDKVNVCGLHSDLKQKDRLKKLEKFRNSSCGVLVTTDLSARGLDLPDVDTVIHVNCPRVLELFIHRSGRTARAGRKGTCIIIRTPCEDGAWRRTLDAVNITPHDITVNSRDIAFMKHLLMVVNDYEGAQHREQRDNKERAWMKKMALDADLPFSDDDNNQDDNDDDDDDDWDNVNQRAISSSSSSSKRSKQLSEIKDLIATPLPTLQTR
ncbi:ATP-dependent RNA helicase, putative [Perkinsus marinus ATCC 50983]|uniref:ATP-dependent RNA helicase n=1 Tax=Perkinsus marinus (strain ATCC 50983 / TXsc) TaxID=423536 RepID=C5KTQ6_PERM5|nr:ATP-dependent RNA helicase, putative [Perkinsus marinus ATCC 50983]EER11948.1 ATP-dependent RNA helicase, putative [Perkinsus marinus ATCC 50983]|eukprot:XP_002780153.1 ATP-dependent RNA helicase, putative [Perkinsus marinus ATCC 50983]